MHPYRCMCVCVCIYIYIYICRHIRIYVHVPYKYFDGGKECTRFCAWRTHLLMQGPSPHSCIRMHALMKSGLKCYLHLQSRDTVLSSADICSFVSRCRLAVEARISTTDWHCLAVQASILQHNRKHRKLQTAAASRCRSAALPPNSGKCPLLRRRGSTVAQSTWPLLPGTWCQLGQEAPLDTGMRPSRRVFHADGE